jgi:POT family proton-dependent oligopeptide transporter
MMELHGLPNDVISNIDPLALIVLIPFFDMVLYPLLRKFKINFTPIKRITAGFFCGFLAMVWATVLQLYIYRMSPCGYDANTCADDEGNPIVSPINIGVSSLHTLNHPPTPTNPI